VAATPTEKRHTGPVAYVVIIGGFAAMLLVSQPFFEGMRDQSRHAECLTNLEFIATTLQENPRALRACGPFPSAPPSAEAVSWADAPACWDRLKFERDLSLWGQYEVRPEGTGWSATCRLDVDGDGDAIVFEATDARTAAHRSGTED